jgi:exonuclease VII large subunit
MAKEKQNNSGALNEISAIRNILMGQQITEYDSRLDLLDGKIDDLHKQLQTQLEEMEARYQERIQQLAASVNKRFEELENQLSKKTEALDVQIQKETTSSKQELSAILEEMSRKVLKLK